MKIVFLILRTTYYKFFAPLIQEALNHGYEVECWHDYMCPQKGTKFYLFPDINLAPKIFTLNNNPQYRSYQGNKELAELLQYDQKINVVVSLHRILTHFEKGISLPSNLWWAIILHGPDSFLELEYLRCSKSQVFKNEIFYLYSYRWLKLGRSFFDRFYPEKKWLLGEKTIRIETIGNPEFDIFQNISSDTVRKKHGIPNNKQLLLYLPFPYNNRSRSAWEKAFCGFFINTLTTKDGAYCHDRRNSIIKNSMSKFRHFLSILNDPIARKYFLNRINEIHVFRKIREFCNQNDLYLVVKPRLKFPIPEIIKSEADLVIWDDEKQQNPSIFKELLAISRICVSYNSYSVFSAVFAGVYHINIDFPDVFYSSEASKYWFPKNEGSLFNFPGCSLCWTSEELIKNLGETKLQHFSLIPEKRDEYLKEYNKITSYGSAELFCKSLKKLS